MTDLDPCPHCGSGKIVEDGAGFDGPNWCSCGDCGTRGPSKLTADLAVAAWNALPRTRWVSVDERLPEPYRSRYVVAGGDGFLFGVNCWVDLEGVWRSDEPRRPRYTVAAWLDGIPELPDENDSADKFMSDDDLNNLERFLGRGSSTGS